MSRETLIHTLREALDALGHKVRNGDQDIQIPDLDDAILALARVRPRRQQGPPPYWR
jgi:hypothetical protein